MTFFRHAIAFVWLLAAAGMMPGAATAQNQTVVVELYTSQGCSSCPPADEIFRELAKQDDVIALGLHVHYWDYLGWKDNFAQEKFARRQEYMNISMSSRYRRVTPQMLFNGQTQVAGARREKIAEQIRAMRAQRPLARLEMTTRGDELELRVKPLSGKTGPSDIHLVHYLEKAVVPIERGENRGRTLHYANVVSSWDTIGQWNGRDPARFRYKLRSDEPFAVIVQGRDFGPIYTARRMD